jgi:hypothetical protein
LVNYYRCFVCGFLFTPMGEGWTVEEWRRNVYNDAYPLHDPEAAQRCADTAKAISMMIQERHLLRILDYGAGQGNTVHALRSAKFTDVHGYDPITGYGALPDRGVDICLVTEVLEHMSWPRQFFEDVVPRLGTNAVVLVSTQLVPPDVIADWWYISPRVGHVSIQSEVSIRLLAAEHGLRFKTISTGLHSLTKGNPTWLNLPS